MFLLVYFGNVPIWETTFMLALAVIVVNSCNIEMLHVLRVINGEG